MEEPTPSDDMDALLDHLLTQAVERLEAEGDFNPFAAAIDERGELRVFGLESESGDAPPQEAVDELVASLAAAAKRGEIRAAAVCANVTLPSPAGEGDSEAAVVQLEHRDDDPVDIALPYELHDDHIHTGELVAGVGKHRIFG